MVICLFQMKTSASTDRVMFLHTVQTHQAVFPVLVTQVTKEMAFTAKVSEICASSFSVSNELSQQQALDTSIQVPTTLKKVIRRTSIQ